MIMQTNFGTKYSLGSSCSCSSSAPSSSIKRSTELLQQQQNTINNDCLIYNLNKNQNEDGADQGGADDSEEEADDNDEEEEEGEETEEFVNKAIMQDDIKMRRYPHRRFPKIISTVTLIFPQLLQCFWWCWCWIFSGYLSGSLLLLLLTPQQQSVPMTAPLVKQHQQQHQQHQLQQQQQQQQQHKQQRHSFYVAVVLAVPSIIAVLIIQPTATIIVQAQYYNRSQMNYHHNNNLTASISLAVLLPIDSSSSSFIISYDSRLVGLSVDRSNLVAMQHHLRNNYRRRRRRRGRLTLQRLDLPRIKRNIGVPNVKTNDDSSVVVVDNRSGVSNDNSLAKSTNHPYYDNPRSDQYDLAENINHEKNSASAALESKPMSDDNNERTKKKNDESENSNNDNDDDTTLPQTNEDRWSLLCQLDQSVVTTCGNHTTACFYLDSKCNGVSDCPNGYDESEPICGCMEHEFLCNETCIDKLLIVCDTKVDCQDQSDEQNCETYVCPETHFKCNNHFCIPAENVCDFQNNCGDNSDEEECTHRDCWFGEYKCDNGQCIQAYGVCNGANDCVDGSDEKQCHQQDFVYCGNGISVHRSLWCDGRPDCIESHQDELNCKVECKPNEYRCSNSRCIPLGNLCDTVCDCAQSCDDELNCTKYYNNIDGISYCSTENTIACSFSEDSRIIERCLGREYICNGFSDCPPLFDDEFGCPHGGYNEENCLKLSDHFWCPIERRCLPGSIRCNFIGECLNGYDEIDCDHEPCTGFQCTNGQCIDLNQRCNSEFDCFDKSDEIGCANFSCPSGYKKCHSGQCIQSEWWCDYFEDCLDKSDELNCANRNTNISVLQQHQPLPESTNSCDIETEFRCNNGQCIPIQFRCLKTANPRQQCADGSNLFNCTDWNCQLEQQPLILSHSARQSQLDLELHHAHHSQNDKQPIKCGGSYCIESQLKCNEKLDCPVLSDWADEQFCPFRCSKNQACQCIDTTINCSDLGLTKIPEGIEDQILRMIMKGNKLGYNLTLNMFNKLDRMHMIDMSENEISYIPPGLFKNLWKLRILHFRKNNINIIDSYTFTGLPNLGTLSLNGNKIFLLREYAFSGLASLKTLDLSNQQIGSLQKNSFSGLRSLKNLDLSGNHIRELDDGVFSGLLNVISIDFSSNGITKVGSKSFLGLNSLKQITFDEFRFCCLARHVETCYPPADEFSSCEDLMSNNILRICIWVLGTVALIGNMFVILWRLKYQTANKVHSFLIINLALGDFLMGIYLLIIASIDSYYRGIYFIVDASWRQSSLCHFAGFLSTLSSEFSVFSLLVITIDRLISITLPFRIYKMRMKDAKLIIAVLWLVAILLSGLPLIRFKYFDNFYGRSGVCLALHITNQRPNGWEYSVFIFLVLNFISFTLICGSYLWMFIAARNTQIAARTKETSLQNRMARRMMFIVMTDFFCWMPIISLGIVSLFGIEIPPQVFAWIAVFVLPLNAAINPTLYTMSGLTFGFRKSNSNSTSAASPKSLIKMSIRNNKPNNNNNCNNCYNDCNNANQNKPHHNNSFHNKASFL